MTTQQLEVSMAQESTALAAMEVKATELQMRQQAAQTEFNAAKAAILNSEADAPRRASEAKITLDAWTGELARQRAEVAKAQAHHAELARQHGEAQKFDRLAELARAGHEKRHRLEQTFTATAATLASGIAAMNQLLDELAELRQQFVDEVKATGTAPDIQRSEFAPAERQKMETLESQLRRLSDELIARGTDLYGVLAAYEQPRVTRPVVYHFANLPYQPPAVPMGSEVQAMLNKLRSEAERDRQLRSTHY